MNPVAMAPMFPLIAYGLWMASLTQCRHSENEVTTDKSSNLKTVAKEVFKTGNPYKCAKMINSLVSCAGPHAEKMNKQAAQNIKDIVKISIGGAAMATAGFYSLFKAAHLSWRTPMVVSMPLVMIGVISAAVGIVGMVASGMMAATQGNPVKQAEAILKTELTPLEKEAIAKQGYVTPEIVAKGRKVVKSSENLKV